MALTAKDGAADLRLERHLVVLAAVIADNLVPLWGILARCGLLRTAARAALRRHHVPLIKDLLFLFGEKKGLFTLDANCFYIGHNVTAPGNDLFGMEECYHTSTRGVNQICPESVATCSRTVVPSVSRL